MGLKEKIRQRRTILPDAKHHLENDFTLGKKLGEGAFGTVFLANSKKSNEQYACKSMEKSKMCTLDADGVRNEVAVLKAIKGCKHTVQFLQAYEDRENVHLIMSLCSGGELFDRIVAKGKYSERDACSLFRVMLETVNELHDKSIAHLDLKPDNFLFDGPGDKAELILTDFGVSEFFKPGEYLKDPTGTPSYVAPEVIQGKFNEKADIWSLGVILFVLLSGKIPWEATTQDGLFRQSAKGVTELTGHPWDIISPQAKDLVKKMLRINCDLRPSADDCLHHPWITDPTAAKGTDLGEEVLKGIKHCAELNKLQKRARQIMCKHVKECDVAHLKIVFEKVDVDRSGFISLDELKKALKEASFDVSDEQLDTIVKSYDVNDDGQIEWSEFVSAMLDAAKFNSVDIIHQAFKELDKDHDGAISPEEVLHALKDIDGMDIQQAKALVEEADKDGDGRIDWGEFYKMMIEQNAEMKRVVSAHGRKRLETKATS